MSKILIYQVLPGENLPAGLPLVRLPVLSPVWEGPALHLEYRDGELETLVGWQGTAPGAPCNVRVFWTRHEPRGPAVCLAIGGNGGLKVLGDPAAGSSPRGLAFLALAESLIPREVREVIGPAPAPGSPLLLG